MAKDDFKIDRTPPYAPIEIHKANAGVHQPGAITYTNRPDYVVITPTAQGTKHDQGKPDLSLVSSELMIALARVREFGAKKYHRDNWKQGFKFTRSIAAALRHILAFKDKEDLDPESGLTHIAHAIASLEHLLYDYTHRKESNDDR